MTYDSSAWENLEVRGERTKDSVWSRVDLLTRHDPFAYVLQDSIRSAYIAGVLNGTAFLRYPTHNAWKSQVKKMPYYNLFSAEFHEHMAAIFVHAHFPQGVPKDE